MKYYLIASWLFFLLGVGCNNQNTSNEMYCAVSEIENFDSIKGVDSLSDISLLANKIFENTDFDTLCIFRPYTNKDTIFHYVNCYNNKFDTIAYDDQFYLLILNKDGNLKYKYLNRNNFILNENKKYSRPAKVSN